MESKNNLLEQIKKEELMYIIKSDESMIEGTSSVEEYVKSAKKQGIGKLLLADKNSLAAMVDFITECKKEKIKPILGATLSVDFPEIDNHFLLFSNYKIINTIEQLFNFKIFDLFKKNNDIKINLISELVVSADKYKKSKSKTRTSIFINEISSIFENASDGNYNLIKLIDLDKEKIEKDYIIKFKNNIEISALELSELLSQININNKLKRSDIVVSVMNDKGLQNLKDLISLSFLEGQEDLDIDSNGKRAVDSYPYVSIDNIKKYSEGLVFFLGDRRDALGRDIIELNTDGKEIIQKFKNILGDSLTLYSKISTDQDHPIYVSNEIKLNDKILELSLTENIPCIATHDARFAEKEMYQLHDIKRAILLGENVHSVTRNKEEYKNQYLISPQELINNFKNYPEMLLNNIYISDIPKYNIKFDKSILPEFPIPEDFEKQVIQKFISKNNIEIINNDEKESIKEYIFKVTKEKFPEDEWDYERDNQYNNLISGEYMSYLAWQGIESKMVIRMKKDEWENKKQEYYDRFLYESNIINNMGFSGYFLIVQEFINWAKSKGVPVGTGRGSGAGSLVAFGLNITGLDPVKDGLLFERFLNPERVSMPDFDIDFGEGFDELGNIVGRDDVIQHVKETYINNTSFPSVSQIATRGEFGLKSGVKAIAKALGHTIPFEQDLIVLVPDTPDFSFDAFLQIPEIAERYETEAEFRYIIDIAQKLEGKKQSSGVHAGGVVIADKNGITKFCPVQCSPDGSGLVTQLTKNPVEKAGLVKFDFLGLKTLSVVELTIKNIFDKNKIKIDINNIPENDNKTFIMLQEGKTNSVFQVESSGMTALMKQLQVEDIAAISDLLALYRPGPMESGMLENFVNVRKEILKQRQLVDPNIKDIKSVRMDLLDSKMIDSFTPLHTDLLSILSPTNNQMIYQEQVMQSAQILADYSLGGADLLRRAMGKKKPEEMALQKQIFITGALNKYREHFMEVTKKSIGQSINLDFKNELNKLSLQEYLDEFNGLFFLANQPKILKLFKDYIGYSEEDYINIHKNINNMKVKNFQLEHSKKIIELLNNKFKNLGIEESESDNYAKKIYFSIAQFVRFNHIFSAIEKFAAYGFNKSHSLAYANITYQTAYLKANYTPEFFSAVLTFQQDSLEKINMTAVDMRLNHSIKLLKPDVNKNKFSFTPNDEYSILYGLAGIKSLGNSGFIIVKEKEINGDYQSIEDLVYRFSYRAIKLGNHSVKLNSGAFSALAFSGALDSLIPTYVNNCNEIKSKRHYLIHIFNKIQHMIPSKKDELTTFINDIVEDRINLGYYSNQVVFTPNNSKKPLEQILDIELAYSNNADIAWEIEPLIELGVNGKPKKPKKQMISFPPSLDEKMNIIYDNCNLIPSVNKHIKNLFDDFKKVIIEATNVEKLLVLGKEKEYTGLYLSEHPVNINNIKSRSFVNSSVKNLENIINITQEKQGEQVTIIGVINTINTFPIKNGDNAGKNMAKISVEDETGEINITLFSKQFSLVEEQLMQNTVIKITGEIDYKEEYGISIKPHTFQNLLPQGNEIVIYTQNNGNGKKNKYRM